MSSVPRFFIPPEAIRNGIATLPAEAAHHALRVLRLQPGEPITLLDGQENIFHATLEPSTGGTVIATITTAEKSAAEPKLRVTVAQALTKTAEKLETVLQHGTEIGAAGFIVWQAQRSVARLESQDKRAKRLHRWRGIIQGAAEQSGRGVLPNLDWADDITVLIARFARWEAVLVLHESAALGSFRAAMEALPANATDLLFIVGPEGGLPDTEVAVCRAAGAQPVCLGPRVLRTETAALAAVAQALYARGE